MNIWEIIRGNGNGGFTPSENWGDHKKVSGLTLWLLFMIRLQTGWPFVVHNAFELQGHSENSEHYKGTATDGHFVTDTPFDKQVIRVTSILSELQVSDFCGLGIYPDWNSPGFHFDTRGYKARWGMVNKNGKQVQVTFDDAYKVARGL